MRCYLYHETKDPIIINRDDLDQYVDWEESPLLFVKTTDFGVDPKDATMVQALGESISGVKDFCNGMLNLDLMNMKSLKAFSEEHFSEKIKARSKTALIKKIEAKNDDSHRYH